MVCTENDQYCDPSKKIPGNHKCFKDINCKNLVYFETKFAFYWKADKSFWCWKRGQKNFFFTIMIGFIISRVHFIISVLKFSTVFKKFVRKFLDEIAIDLRSMITRSVKICNAWICAHMPRIHRLLTKGQIISEQICGVLKFTKKATKYCQDFCPSL